jgi:hypothetical protein
MLDSEQTRIKGTEMRFPTAVSGYKLTDKKMQQDIREELGIFSVSTKITEYRTGYTM